MTTPPATPAVFGDHCQIDPSATLGDAVVVHARASIGADVVVGAGSHIGLGSRLAAGVRLGERVHVDSGVTFAPPLPPDDSAVATTVADGAVIGAGVVVWPGVVIGAQALVRPGAVVTRSVPPAAIVEGNPATIVGYVDAGRGPGRAAPNRPAPAARGVEATPVQGVTVHTFPVITDLRGDLTVGEFERQIPFVPLRYFMVFGVPNREVRGEHAHRECHQFLICVRGNCAVVADDGSQRVEVLLDAPNIGVHLPPMTWGVQYKYSADALLLVFASHHYDAADYIRDHDEFLALTRRP